MDAKRLEQNYLMYFIVMNLIANSKNAQGMAVFTKDASFY